MKQETRNRELIVQYLLGELSEEDEAVWLELQYFGDDAFFEQLLIVENELIDSYVRDELSQGERERFEGRFLASPKQRQRVEIARELVEYATELSAALPAPDKGTPIKRQPVTDRDLPEDGIDLEAYLAQIERDYIIRALQRTTGNQTRAAAILRMSVKRLRHFLSKHRILSTGLRGESGAGPEIQIYVRGEMPDREHSEARPSTTSWWTQSVEFGKAWIKYATRRSTPHAAPVTSSQPLRRSPGAKNRAIILLVGAVLILLVSASLFETVRLSLQIGRIQADRAEALQREQELERQLAQQGAQNEQLADDLQRERTQVELLEEEMRKQRRSTLGAITFILSPDLVRGASEPAKLIIPRDAELVRIQLDLDRQDYSSYRVVLATLDSQRVWNSGLLKARPNKSGQVVVLGLPASLFTNRGYILTLSGVNAGGSLENAGEYYFNVVKK